MMLSYSYIGFGINVYASLPESSLNQCVHDVQNLSAALASAGYQCQTYFDAQCRKADIVQHMSDAIRAASACEKAVLVIHQSGHGSQQRQTGDSTTVKDDGMDEVMVCYDTKWNYSTSLWDNVLADYEIGKLFSAIPDNVLVVLVADTCCSGTITRGIRPIEMVGHRKFIYPRDWIVRATDIAPDWKSGFVPTDNRNFVLLAGAAPNNFSYECPSGGVLTSSVVKCVKSTIPSFVSRNDLIASVLSEVRRLGFDQTPHYECRAELMPKAEFCFDNERLAQKKTEPAARSLWSWLVGLFR